MDSTAPDSARKPATLTTKLLRRSKESFSRSLLFAFPFCARLCSSGRPEMFEGAIHRDAEPGRGSEGPAKQRAQIRFFERLRQLARGDVTAHLAALLADSENLRHHRASLRKARAEFLTHGFTRKHREQHAARQFRSPAGLRVQAGIEAMKDHRNELAPLLRGFECRADLAEAIV